MIRNRRRRPRLALPIGIGAALALGAIFSLRPAQPMAADPAAAAQFGADLDAAAAAADAALTRLAAVLGAALDDARRGAAATVSGDLAPGPSFVAAAERFTAASGTVADARAALARVAALLAALPGSRAPLLVVSADELASVAAQLQATGPTADAFYAMRQSSARALQAMQAALVALDGHDATAALVSAERGSVQLAEVRAWDGRIDTLPIWVDVSGRLLDALRDLAAARLDGDAVAAGAAARRFAAAAAEADRADRAWAIALAEGGGAISAPALAAAAQTLSRTQATIAELAPLVHP